MSLADQLWCPTSVQVTVHQARGLRIKGKSGTNDAYAVMQVGKEKYQTSVVEKSVAPVWKEEASFDLPQLHGGGGGGGGGGGTERSTLHVHVLHRALVGPDKPLGQAVINLRQLSEDESRNKTEWFKLLDKTGKADKDRGEVLVDIQFMRNNMTASMFDLSAAGKSRSRLGKFKDKVRGKKKESDTVSSVVPSFSQVLTDSEEEEGNGDAEASAGKDEKKKKNKMKSLFSPKSNLQKNMSQSMSVLPGKNSPLSGSQSSGLNVDSSEGKKKFKFLMHKRSGSSDSKDSSSGHQKHGAAEQSNLCINGSHIYCEEPQTRTSRIGSSFSLASSGHGSMEEVPESSPPSVDSLRGVRQYSPWTEEEEEETADTEHKKDVVELEKEDEERIRMEEERRKTEEEMLRKQEEAERLAEEKRKERMRIEEEEKRQREEEERVRMEEERAQEERRRQEEEQKLAEEKKRLEEERRRIEEEKVRKEEEERMQREEEERMRQEELERLAEEKRREEQERRLEEEERKRVEEEVRKKEEERRRREEEEERAQEERRRKEELERLAEEKRREQQERRRLEEEERIRVEEERARQERMRQEEEEMARRQEEERKLAEEKRRLEEEEEIRRIEEEKARKEEEERIRREQERAEEERRRLEEEEELRRQQEEYEEKRRLEEQERRRKDEEERIRIEEEENARRQKEEYERQLKEEERKRIVAEEKIRKEEEERLRMEEERRKEEEAEAENIRRQEEEQRLAEEKRIYEEQERRRIEEKEKREREENERIRKEEERRQEEEETARKEKEEYERILEEKMRQEEEERKRIEEEEKIKQEEQEKVRMEKETRKKQEEDKQRIFEEEERIKREEEERIRRQEKAEEEAMKLETREAEEQKMRQNKTKNKDAGTKNKAQSPAEVISTNPFDEDFTNNPFEEGPDSPEESTVKHRSQSAVSLLGSETGPTDVKDLISTQREKRHAPQPPGRNKAQRQEEQEGSAHNLAQINKQSKDKDIKMVSVPPQRSVQVIAPLSRSPTDATAQSLTQGSATTSTTNVTKHSKRPAPPRPQSVEGDPVSELKTAPSSNDKISKECASEAKQEAIVYGLNPFEVEDEDENELPAQNDTTNTGSVKWPQAVSQAADKESTSQAKIRSSKVAHAPPVPVKEAAISSTLNSQNSKGGHVTDDSGVIVPGNHVTQPCDPQNVEFPTQKSQPEMVKSTGEEKGGKKEGPPVASRRLLPVKPLNPLGQQSVSLVQGEREKNSIEVQEKSKVTDTGIKGPYSQLTREELISLVLKQENQLSQRDAKISELEQYIDNLLVRVMEEQPSILMSMNSVKKPV